MNGKLILAGLAAFLLLAAHLLVFGLAVRSLALPMAAAVALLAILKHLGLLAPFVAWLRRRGEREPTRRS